MNLFGSVMFADSSGDYVPMMYLPLPADLDSMLSYNWGGAVLAYLYYHLCYDCKNEAKQMYGLVLLLQHWSWSRLPVDRPIPNEPPAWGEPDYLRCPSYAKMWHDTHHYKDQDHGGTLGIRLVRSQLQSLAAKQIEWTPYEELYETEKLSWICLDQRERWWYRGPLVCFRIVEHHYPDRVLRQFGEAPLIPVDPDLSRSQIKKLHNL